MFRDEFVVKKGVFDDCWGFDFFPAKNVVIIVISLFYSLALACSLALSNFGINESKWNTLVKILIFQEIKKKLSSSTKRSRNNHVFTL